MNLPSVNIRVIWDGGAEGTSISDRCMSRLLRAQRSLKLHDEDCPMSRMHRMDPPQRFFSFSESHGDNQGTVVEIIGDLRLITDGVGSDDDRAFPPIEVRMVPGQVDDILMSAPDLDRFGFDSHSEQDRFLFHSVGLSASRETPAAKPVDVRAVAEGDVDTSDDSSSYYVRVARTTYIPAHSTVCVDVACSEGSD